MLPAELPPPSPKHQPSFSSAHLESLRLRQSYLHSQHQHDEKPPSKWLAVLYVLSAFRLMIEGACVLLMQKGRRMVFSPVEERAAPLPSTSSSPPRSSPASTSVATPWSTRPSSVETRDNPSSSSSSSTKEGPPELVPSYANSVLSEDSEELLEEEEDDGGLSAALYGQGDSIEDSFEPEDGEDDERNPDFVHAPVAGISTPNQPSPLAQLKQSIGVMSQEAKEQEAVSVHSNGTIKKSLS